MGQPGYGVLATALSTKMKVCALGELRFWEGETDNKQINARNNVCVCVCVCGVILQSAMG